MQTKPIHFLDKLSDRLRKDNRLELLQQQFINNYQFFPSFGIEIEFYLSENINPILFNNKLGLNLKPEKGNCQFEVDLPPSSNLTLYVKQIEKLRTDLQNIAIDHKGKANLESKPFLDDYGSSMHFNLSFTDNIETLEYAAKSLCHFMLDTFLIFMPNAADYARSDPRFMAPTHLSYGGNNRTTAIRIPDSKPLRLEHRVSSPLADPYLVTIFMLTTILKGLQSPDIITDLPKIYGNAYDPQYNLKLLPQSIDEATALFKPEFFSY